MSQINSIEVNPSKLTLEKGRWYRDIEVQAFPEDATCDKIVWSSTVPSVASVNSSGLIYTKTPGVTNIKAAACSDSSICACMELTVTDTDKVYVKYLNLSSTSISLKKGETATLTANPTPAYANDRTVIFTSNNENVATVDSSGNITAVGKGTTFIRVDANDGGGAVSTCKITVTEVVPVTSVTVSPKAKTLYIRNNNTQRDTVALTATVLPSTAGNKGLTWRSSDTSVATVDQNGNVTAKGVGIAQIYAKSQDGTNIEDYSVIEVNYFPITSLEITSSDSKVFLGEYLQLDVDIYPTNAGCKKIAWSSSNTGVAEVDSTGFVTPKEVGTVTITATATDGSGKSDSFEIKVIEYICVESVAVVPRSLTLDPEETAKLEIKLEPENATLGDVTWWSDDTSVATVDSEGNVTAGYGGYNMAVSTVIHAYSEDNLLQADIPVCVDTREKVYIRRDRECDGVYFNICFADGTVWQNIGCDLSVSSIKSGGVLEPNHPTSGLWYDYERRYVYNIQQKYTEEQLALIYFFDPLGLEFYMKNCSLYLDSDDPLLDALFLRDRVYLKIFGNDEINQSRFYFKIVDENPVYGRYVGESRKKVFSNAEALFGSHTIIDWGEVIKAVISAVFSSLKIPDWMTVTQLGVEAAQAIFFSGSILGTGSDSVQELISNYNEEVDDEAVEAAGKTVIKDSDKPFKIRAMGWGKKLMFSLGTSILTSLDDMFVSLGDVVTDIPIQTKANSQDYCVKVCDEDIQMSLQDVIEMCKRSS